MIQVQLRQDCDGDWFWIPVELLGIFNELDDKLCGLAYMDSPDDFDEFEEMFGGFRTGGVPELRPQCFKDKEVQVIFNIEE